MELPKSGVIVCDQSLCSGCGVCELICSLSHHGMINPVLSGIHVKYDAFADCIEVYLCQQCASPGCYSACPLPGEALRVHELSGARYIDQAACTGCGCCLDGCSFTPPRLRLRRDSSVAFKCDLCRGRETGPLCVEYCKHGALRLVPREMR